VRVAKDVRIALDSGAPVVALESAVATHGLPFPANLEAMRAMSLAVRAVDAVPAVCLILHGRLLIGATESDCHAATVDPEREKAAIRDLGVALARGATAGLTVSATIWAAALAGIRVFATGGIGGVHVPAASADVSADLVQLSYSSVVTVCSGAKSVLDIPRTLELLETLGVPVLGYRSSAFPAFYVASSGEPVPRVDTSQDVVSIARAHWSLGLRSALVVANPVPRDAAIAAAEFDEWLAEAQSAATRDEVRGKALTPYLLGRLADLSGGRTVSANLALLESNARVAAEIARAFSP
jgi:pseudouridine-5'-phosphate glycosidase